MRAACGFIWPLKSTRSVCRTLLLGALRDTAGGGM
jgi:hypothetical protein